MKFLLGLALVFFLNGQQGCEDPPKAAAQHYNARVYVRSLAIDTKACESYVVLEGEDGSLWSVRGRRCEMPPVWVGLHAQLEYDADAGYPGAYCNFKVTRRLP